MRQEVRDFCQRHPKCEKLVRVLSTSFEVTFATDRKFHQADFHVLFLKPNKDIAAAFGLKYEILAVYSPFPAAQPRIAQAIEQFVNDEPAKGRVDRLVVFVFSDDPTVSDWADHYAISHPDSRIMLASHASSLWGASNPTRAIREVLQKKLYHSDLFDYRLPLNSDAFYFGRSNDLAKVINAIDRGENFGIFGLRKTGKTSFVFKIRRVLEDSGDVLFLYFDCKLPEIRSLSWQALLERICRELAHRVGSKWREVSGDAALAQLFRQLIGRGPGRIVLAFDEIEFISPDSRRNPHWKSEFVDFWQTMWGVQSELRKLSLVICGVIPRVVEVERFEGVQNPLFSIVRPHFLKGFPEEDVRKMVEAIGGKVGVRFESGAIQYLVTRYGGHPYLTRLVCSNLLEKLDLEKVQRPVDIGAARLVSDQDLRERELVPYIRHIVAELIEFYPIEYEILELLSCDRYSEYYEMAAEPELVDHLRAFGIVVEVSGVDQISIPVAKKYISSEYLRRNGHFGSIELVPTQKRREWLTLRLRAILGGIRQLAAHFRTTVKEPFLPAGGVPEGDRLIEAPVADSDHTLTAFLMIANRSLVESVESFLKERGNPSPIYNVLPKMLPKLAIALQRVKVYRHDTGHIELSDPKVVALRDQFLREDLGGRPRSAIVDVDFVLQQCLVDGLMNAVQAELVANRLV